MQRHARETGGAYFDVSDTAGRTGQLHKIRLTAKTTGLTVQTRDGYYSH